MWYHRIQGLVVSMQRKQCEGGLDLIECLNGFCHGAHGEVPCVLFDFEQLQLLRCFLYFVGESDYCIDNRFSQGILSTSISYDLSL